MVHARGFVGALIFTISAGVAAPAGLAQQSTGSDTRTVYVTAVRDNGEAVPDLTAADLRVKEDGKNKPVLNAARLDKPLAVVLMVDNSGLGLQSMREGAAAFVTRLEGRAEIAMLSTAGRNTVVTDYTTSTATLLAGINRLSARSSTGAYLLEALLEASRTFTAREVSRPVIVSVAVEGNEFSNTRAEDVLNALQRSKAQLYLVRLGQPVIGQSNAVGLERGESFADESIQLNAVLGQAPARSGGRNEQLVQHTGIPKAMDRIAMELLSQYAVTYSGADLAARDVKLEIETSRRGVKLRAPTRVGPRR